MFLSMYFFFNVSFRHHTGKSENNNFGLVYLCIPPFESGDLLFSCAFVSLSDSPSQNLVNVTLTVLLGSSLKLCRFFFVNV